MKTTIIATSLLFAASLAGFATGRATAPEALIVGGHVVLDTDGSQVRNLRIANGYIATAPGIQNATIAQNEIDVRAGHYSIEIGGE